MAKEKKIISYDAAGNFSIPICETKFVGQTFTWPISSGIKSTSITKIGINIGKTGNTAGSFTVNIIPMKDDVTPEGYYSVTGGTIPTSDIVETKKYYIPVQPCPLKEGKKYALCFLTWDGNEQNLIYLNAQTPGKYTDGKNIISNDAGYTWEAGEADLLFEIWGT